jgi:hypothetical protein
MSKLLVVEYHENTSLCFICIASSWKWAQISPAKSRSITIRKAGELQISQSLTCKHSFFDTIGPTTANGISFFSKSIKLSILSPASTPNRSLAYLR